MDIDKKISELINLEQYILRVKEKEEKLLPILLEKLKTMKNEKMISFYKRLSPIEGIKKLADIAPLPVNLFKIQELLLVPKKEIIRVLTSSGTTTQIKSKIYLNKKTAFRQSIAFNNILKNHVGRERRPMLIIDTQEVINPKNHGLTARGVAIRAVMQFGRDVTFILEGSKDLTLNLEKLEEFVKKYSNKEVIIFGFTYIIWSVFYKELKKLNKTLKLKGVLIHSGGWKKLTKQKISKEIFNYEINRLFGIKSNNVLDMYGLVEQVGVVFIDCPEGNKHVPNFAEVIIRNPLTMEEIKLGEKGLIEILSVLPDSYPGHALITEDVGLFEGIDDCKCGRKGKYFKFVSRIEKSETRGCGDTFS